MTYANTTLALDQYIPLLSLTSKPSETKVILADFIEGKVLSLDADKFQLPSLNPNNNTLKSIARSVYQEYGIFTNPSHYQDVGQRGDTHYFVGFVNSNSTPQKGEWLNISDINNGTIPSSQKVKSLLEELVHKIN